MRAIPGLGGWEGLGGALPVRGTMIGTERLDAGSTERGEYLSSERAAAATQGWPECNGLLREGCVEMLLVETSVFACPRPTV